MRPRTIRTRFRGHDWTVVYRDEMPEAEKDFLGVTHEGRIAKRIRIFAGLWGFRRLDTELHEALHAAYPMLDEEAVKQGATDIARLLWRIGYRLKASGAGR